MKSTHFLTKIGIGSASDGLKSFKVASGGTNWDWLASLEERFLFAALNLPGSSPEYFFT